MVRKVRTLVVDDARRPFARETVCCIADKIRAMFVPGSRDSLPRPLQIRDSLPRPLRMRAEALFTRPKNSGGSSGVYDHEGRALVVDDARRPFARETVFLFKEKVRAVFVPVGQAS